MTPADHLEDRVNSRGTDLIWKIRSSITECLLLGEDRKWCGQSNANQSKNCLDTTGACGVFPPLGQRRGAVLFEVVSGSQMAVKVEMSMDRSVSVGKLLKRLDVPEICHGFFSSPERLV